MLHRQSRLQRTNYIAILALAGSIACSRTRVETQQPASIPLQITVAGTGQTGSAKDGFEGVRIEIGSGVKYVMKTVSSAPGGVEQAATLNGLPFEIVGRELHIGPRTYGPLSVGDLVMIDTNGVRINGKAAEGLP